MNKFRELAKPVDTKKVETALTELSENRIQVSAKTASQILSFIDLTSLDIRDTEEKIIRMCEKANRIPEVFKDAGNIAGICVYPVFIPVLKSHLKVPGVKRVSVSAGFPSGQIPLEVKITETKYAIVHGAEEIDIVIPAGKIIQGKLHPVIEEISRIKAVCGEKVVLKVILESGLYTKKEDLQKAAFCALEGGADFLKTSTGKLQPAARPEDVWIMSEMALTYFEATGRRVGIKAAGGIASLQDALYYAGIVSAVLGTDWLIPALFRIGASRLTNIVLSVFNKNAGSSYF